MDSLTYDQYDFLKDLGVETQNNGCYRDGEWVANGGDKTSINPHNNKPIAHIKLASE